MINDRSVANAADGHAIAAGSVKLGVKLAWNALVAACIAFVPSMTTAGTTGNLQGRVVDAGTGAPLTGVCVTATSPSERRTTQSDAAGRFFLLGLTPGRYTISYRRFGFRTTVDTNAVAVVADGTATTAAQMTRAVMHWKFIDGRRSSVFLQDPSHFSVFPSWQPPVGLGIQVSDFLKAVPGVQFVAPLGRL